MDSSFVLFGDPFYHHIINYLIPIDLYHLASTCKRYQNGIKMKQIKSCTINEINRRLSEMFMDKHEFESFQNLMLETKSVISGSFIIQCVIGELWEGSDVDIYTPFDRFSDVNSNKYGKLLVNNTFYKKNESHMYNIRHIHKVVTYTNDVNNIQIISILKKQDINTMCKYINKHIDFNICKNIFYPNYVSFNNINELFTRKSNINNFPSLHNNNFTRYTKYINRGFIFNGKQKLSYTDFPLKGIYHNDNKYAIKKEKLLYGTYEDNKYCIQKLPYKIKNIVSITHYTFIFGTRINICNKSSCYIHYLNPDVEHFHITENKTDNIFII